VDAIGNYVGLFWPLIVKQFQKDYPLEPGYLRGDSPAWKIVRLLGFGLVIAFVSAGLGFVAFLGDATSSKRCRLRVFSLTSQLSPTDSVQHHS
jgi:hypothetical protein